MAMAGEVKGKTFEALVYEALTRLRDRGVLKGEIRWNVKPTRLSIEPDFTVGIDVDTPEVVILVTHSGASHNSHMKYWRNAAEVFEAKAQLPRIARVVSVVFDSNVKEQLKNLQDHVFDAQLIVGDKPYGPVLSRWVAGHAGEMPKDTAKKADMVREAVRESEALFGDPLAVAFGEFVEDLRIAVSTHKRALDPVWHLMREDYAKPRPSPRRRVTSVRRGLGKLVVLTAEERKQVYGGIAGGRRIPKDALPETVRTLRFCTLTVAGWTVRDSEIIEVVKLLGPDRCEAVLKGVPDQMDVWSGELRQLSNISQFLDYIVHHLEEISDPARFTQLLVDCHRSPEIFATSVGVMFTGQLERNWLFTTLMDLIKAGKDQLAGFGYAQLSSELSISDGVSSGYITIADWVNRKKNATLPIEVLHEIATVIGRHISTLGVDGCSKLSEELLKVSIKSVLEDRLIPYRGFEPLLWLLEAELKRQKKPYTPKATYASWPTELAGTGKQSSTTPFVKVGKTLVHWKSSHTSHVHDKSKELAARARSVRYEYLPETKKFRRRKEASKLALIVDGDWTEENLKSLSDAGWDTIVYPDEIDRLVKEIG